MSTRRYLSHGLIAADRSRAGWGWLPQPVTPPKKSWWSVLRYYSAVARRLLTVLTLPWCVDVLPPRTWRVPQLQLSQASATRFARGSTLRDVCTPATSYRSFLFKSSVHSSYIPSLTRGRAAQARTAHRGCLPARPTTHTHSLTVSQSHSWKAKERARRAHRAQGAGLKVSVFLAAARRRGNTA